MLYTPKPAKWCSHCEKSNHNDDECWSTRSIPAREYMPITDAIRMVVDRYAPQPSGEACE